jgi:type I restriction enzyme M protein
VFKKFMEIDLHPEVVDNVTMGYIFEELIRKFSELSNETAGEHFTPREVIRLMVDLLFMEDDDRWHTKGIIKTLYDPAAGTGGMLSVAEQYIRELNPGASLKTFGQELNRESFAICKSDLMIKGQDASQIKFGNSFTQDGLKNERFDYFLSNPPFGVEWKKVEREIRDEHEKSGIDGRFGVGLPRISDGLLLFLQHMVSKFKKDGQGSRLAIVFNGSPLFTGGAGSGESEIRRWLIENDWLEAIVALPPDLFYNTGISTYIWIVTNRKSDRRKGKIQLIDASSFFIKMRKSLGNKRNEISREQIAEIACTYGNFREGSHCKIFRNEDFGYWRVTVERPLRLNFAASPERLARIKDEVVRAELTPALVGLTAPVKNRDTFATQLKAALKTAGVTLTPAALKSVLAALGDRPDRRPRPEAVPRGPRPEGAVVRLQAAGVGSLRRGPRRGLHDDPPGRQEDGVPAVQQGPGRRQGQPRERRRLPDGVPVGRSLAAGQLARHPGPVRPSGEQGQGDRGAEVAGRGPRLPAIPPA